MYAPIAPNSDLLKNPAHPEPVEGPELVEGQAHHARFLGVFQQPAAALGSALVIVGLAMVALSTAAGALVVSGGGARIAPLLAPLPPQQIAQQIAPLPPQWERLGEGRPAVEARIAPLPLEWERLGEGSPTVEAPFTASAVEARFIAPAPPAAPAHHVVIPRIGVATEIVDVALKGKEWPVPKFIVGHLAESANPGDVGNAVFAGHLLSLSSGNVFARLGELEVSDELGFFSPNGDRLFRVIETRLVSNRDISVLAARPGKATVTLITCAGTWVPREQDYDQRRVVVAELVNARSENRLAVPVAGRAEVLKTLPLAGEGEVKSRTPSPPRG